MLYKTLTKVKAALASCRGCFRQLEKRRELQLFVCLTILLCSCSKDDNNDVQPVAKKAIVVFMPWSGTETSSGLYNYLLQNLKSIENSITIQKGLGSTQLFVALSNSHTETRLYEVTYGNKGIVHNTIAQYNTSACISASGITGMLNDVKKHTKATTFAMIIGSHGCGWTAIDDWQHYPYNAKPWRNMTGKQQPHTNYPLTRFIGSVSAPEYGIDIATLSKGITDAGITMQYILLDNCYMANIETAYELRHATRHIIASTSEVMSIGMPYSMMWHQLSAVTPDYDAIVSAYHTFYSSYSYPYGTLSAIDCSALDELALTMRSINRAYTFDETLRDSIQILGGFEPTLFYDLGDYVDKLCPDVLLNQQFDSQLNKVVSSAKATARIYSYLYAYSGPKYIPVKKYSGITTSAPSRNAVATKGLPKTQWHHDTAAE